MIVSIGGNDIVLKPTFSTVLSLSWLTKVSSISSIEKGSAFFLSNLKNIFLDGIQDYVKRLIKNKKPKIILICGIYYPSETPDNKSWAQK